MFLFLFFKEYSFINVDYVKYGLFLLLGYYMKKVIKCIKKGIKTKTGNQCNILKKYCYSYFFSHDKNLSKMEKSLFYKNLDKETIEKHGRHINIADIPFHSFNKIFQTKVLIIGIGGLGSPVCFYLSKYGFKEIGLVDGDKVEKSNLHRQIIHKEKHIGLNKTVSAKLTIEDIDNDVNIVCYPFYLDKINGLNIIKNYDIIIDCTDNINSRFLINDICILYKKKLIFGSALGLYGQINVFNLNENTSNCYRCLKNFNNHKENNNCDENGILSTVTGVIGLLQANEAVKLAANLNNEILKNYLTYNSFSNRNPFETLNINHKNKNCICSNKQFKELYNFIINNDYSSNNKKCEYITSYKYDIEAFDFVDILNNNLKFFKFHIDHLCILDVRRYNNTNVYGIKNSIKWNFYEIIELINDYNTNKNKLIDVIFEKLKISNLKGNIVIIIICRKGIDSLKITKHFNNIFATEDKTTNNKFEHNLMSSNNSFDNLKDKKIYTYNIKGGYSELRKKIFKNLPFF
ncbi:ubiquitin-activating enzyme, putative [Plasmodium gallinaceum]|uniref:Ubiquitin-activating enzyme, putative n=1 Tax=Plasmodium gallinaceum TaxID=5849 RepID=A0A1J1GNZ2_PLAGA|nr:ubiquitin-activating enzyme, putative [Plasmodium gallinaceum]CRG94012.1 ubiquitin-activating enzyme, putative [Plasmodium gallinaceum]